MPRINKYLEAFKESYNTIPLATVVAASAALLSPLPLLGALVIEAVYLLFVPDSKWYDQRLSEKYDQEVIQRREKLKAEVYPTLSTSMQNRFARLEAVRSQISAQTFEGKRWFREVLRKLDYLMEKFLLFASKEVQFRKYLATVLDDVDPGSIVPPPFDPRRRRRPDVEDQIDEAWIKATVTSIQDRYTKEVEGIDEMLTSDDNLHNQAVLDKRKEVLGRRKVYLARIGEILSNLTHQLHLMEDTFGLINDEIRARSPEQVLADIEDVVDQTDTLTETLQEVSPFDQMPVAAGGNKLYDVTEGTT